MSHAAFALPSGASIQRGSVGFSLSPNLLTINQSSTNAVINWSNFSIDQSGAVQINNASGATLNRVTGPSVSTLDGQLSATGSVYLINPNGVIIGKSGVVNVGGNFAASTLDVPDSSLGGSGNVELSGSSTASVINEGAITALGGFVFLAAAKVVNMGSITAPNGDVGLLAGTDVILLTDPSQGNGHFSVAVGGAGTFAKNTGAINAAEVELRANGGNVYALAGNTSGVINATGVSTNDGKVFLVADDGYTVADEAITDTKSDGAGGGVVLSGIKVAIAGSSVVAGNWKIKQDDFVLTAAAAAVLAANLASTGVTIQATGANDTPPGGDIHLATSLNWSSSNSLTLSALDNILVRTGVTLSSSDGAQIIQKMGN